MAARPTTRRTPAAAAARVPRRPRVRPCATSRARPPGTRSSGTSGRSTTSCSAWPRTTIRPRTCPKSDRTWLTRGACRDGRPSSETPRTRRSPRRWPSTSPRSPSSGRSCGRWTQFLDAIDTIADRRPRPIHPVRLRARPRPRRARPARLDRRPGRAGRAARGDARAQGRLPGPARRPGGGHRRIVAVLRAWAASFAADRAADRARSSSATTRCAPSTAAP